LTIRIGVIGTGRWGKNHVRVLKELEREGIVKLTSVCDISRDRVMSIGNEYNIEIRETDYTKIIRYVDAVVIATPIDILANIAKTMIENNIHVLIEKPVATNAKDAYEILQLSQSKGVIAMPGMIMRFNPIINKLKNILNSDEHKVKYIVFRRLSRRPLELRKYPLILDLAVHDIDLCRYLTNSNISTIISSTIFNTPIDDIILASLKTTKNIVCILNIDGVSPHKVREIDVVGENSLIRVDTDKNYMNIYLNNEVKSIEVPFEEPLKNEDRRFVLKIKGIDVDIPTMNDAIEYLKIAEKIIKESTYSSI